MNTQTINELINKCHELAKANGWWHDLPVKCRDRDCYCGSSPDSDKCNNQSRNQWLARKIDLIASEGAEAMEALRKGRRADRAIFEAHVDSINDKYDDENNQFDQDVVNGWIATEIKDEFKHYIKDSFADEVADIFIRTCDMMGFYGLEFENAHYYVPDNDSTTDSLIREIRLDALGLASRGNFQKSTRHIDLLNIIHRTLEIAKLENFDLLWHIQEKLKYNQQRGRKHGKEF